MTTDTIQNKTAVQKVRHPIRNVCVYCGASSNVAQVHKDTAWALGRALGEAGMQLVYGGGRVGLMGLVAKSTMEHGGTAVGIIPHHIETREEKYTELTELYVVDSMHERKQMMVDRADAFVVLSGGLGTLDEFFEIMTWRQLGLHDKPVVLLNVNNFWTPLLSLIDHMINNGFARESDRAGLMVADRVEAVMAALQYAPPETMDAQTGLI
ncbi:LOG family protein [Micavibrio aeruginosavorus]|uniref:Cytokinin riboside 5'-monophosphate phosphoribohydrolase n=1 Tax=Micavibrio aeruginosavorus (strain ARL-13) TaxID=856793 RepID=G2KMM9_MICAA|nr:TIGR00730 family Rossman fold protein [Micavibrio aeruginosavorus]AEP08416.1 putative lysine decarboxylase family protein [Micavibrio aeruginosavorus ARL-13]